MRTVKNSLLSLLLVIILLSMISVSCNSINIYKNTREHDLLSLDRNYTSGKNINIPNELHETPLMIAVEKGDFDTVLFLLERGADPNYTRPDSVSPFRLAVRKGDTDIIYSFIQFNADINQKNVDEWTPLMTAAYYGQLESAQLLIEAGANPLDTTHTGYTPYWLAKKNGDRELIQYLDSVTDEANKRVELLEQRALLLRQRANRLN